MTEGHTPSFRAGSLTQQATEGIAVSPFENLEFAYQLRFHFGFRTRYRKPLFGQAEVAATLSALLGEVCGERDYHLLEHRVEPVFLRALVSLRPEHTPSDVAQYLKGVLSRKAKQAHPEAFTTLTDGKVWSDGYFCRSVGRARRSVIEGYVAGQWEHHGYTAEMLRTMRKGYRMNSMGHTPAAWIAPSS